MHLIIGLIQLRLAAKPLIESVNYIWISDFRDMMHDEEYRNVVGGEVKR